MTTTLKELKEMVIVKCLLSQLVQQETWHLHLSLVQNEIFTNGTQFLFSQNPHTL
jgi:hypothetical protein